AGNGEISIVDDHGRNSIVTEGAEAHDITQILYGENYRLNAASFFQANHDLAPSLIDSAIGAEKGQTAIELYCGVGLFTLPLARRFETVVGVEGDAAGADFARLNLAGSNLTNAEIVNGRS